MSGLANYFNKLHVSQALPKQLTDTVLFSLQSAELRVVHYFKYSFPQVFLTANEKKGNSAITGLTLLKVKGSSSQRVHEVKYHEFRSSYFTVAPAKHHESSQETRNLLKKLRAEQQAREQRQQRELEKRQKAIEESEQEEREKCIEEIENREVEKINRLERMKEQSIKRKEEAKNYKVLVTNHPRTKPLFRKLQEEYIRNFEIPELQRRKEELAKKRDLFSPIQLQDIAEHIKAYKHSKNRKKSQSTESLKSPISQEKYKELLSELKGEREKNSKLQQERRELLDKQHRFSEHVKTQYKPKIDAFKHAEIELAKSKAELPAAMKFYKETVSVFSPKPNVPKFNSTLKRQVQKEPENCSEAKSTEEDDKKSSEYLDKRRKIRRKLEEELLLKKGDDAMSSEDLELKAKRCEGLLKYQVSADPFNVKNIQAEDYVNHLYLESVKTKISELE